MKRCLLIGTMLLVGVLLANNGFTADYDASGVWTINETANELITGNPVDCQAEVEQEDYTIRLEQTGDSFGIVVEDGSFYGGGTVSGSTYTITWSEDEDDGTLVIAVTIQLASESSGNGTSVWTFTSNDNNVCQGQLTFELSRTQASGTYSYDPGTGILTADFESSTFPQGCGPEVGTESFEVSSIGATTMIWTDDDEDEMTWTRDSGTEGELVGTWALFEDGTDVGIEATFNEDLTFSVTATSNFECDGDGDGGDGPTPPGDGGGGGGGCFIGTAASSLNW